MKIKLLLAATSIILLFTFQSCRSELDLDKTLKFTKLEVSDQKELIEQNGLDFLSKTDGLRKTKGFIAMKEFIRLSKNDQTDYVVAMSQLQSNLVNNDSKLLETFDRQMRISTDDKDNWGDWTWNPASNSFEFKPVSSKIAIFNFPASETSTTNNATLKIKYVVSKVASPDSNYVDLVPKTISVELKVDGKMAMEAELACRYSDDSAPIRSLFKLEIDKYNWKTEISNDYHEIYSKFRFRYKTETLVRCEMGAKGTFTANIILEKCDCPDELFTTGAVYVQLMNIAFLGGFKDFDLYKAEISALANTNDRKYADAKVDIINKHLVLYGFFEKENRKFADVEFYVDENTYMDYVYNNETGNYDYVEVIAFKIQPRFLLNDGSKVSIETYTETGFEDLIKKLEEYESMK
jgi:hypothetical protein